MDARADHGLISLTAIPFWVVLGGFGWLGAAAEASKASRESHILLDSVGQVPRKTRTHEKRCIVHRRDRHCALRAARLADRRAECSP